jgi:two-component system phosphate regulon sensor histidine kinase PhoR
LPKIQRKLMAALAGLVAVTLLATSWIAERGLRERETAQIEASLRQRAGLVREILEPDPVSDPALQERVSAAAEAAGARVTLIDATGAVRADSAVAAADLARVESHADRPEVRAALSGRVGIASRRSDTIGARLLYLATPRGNGDVVRLAVDLGAVEASVSELRRQLALAGGLGLAAALLFGFAISRLAVRPLSEMRETIAAIARGDLSRRIRPRSDDEIGEIARAINGMAQQLDVRLADVTSEKERLQAVLASMVEGVLVLDSDGTVMLANPPIREILASWGPIEGRKLLEVVRHPGIDSALRAAAESSEPVFSEVQLGDREPRTLLIHATGFPDEGPRLGTVAVFHDVSDLRHLENVRRDFIANASHELRTPLTAIRGFAETLLGNAGSDATRTQIETIMRNAERLEALIGDMMELSRIESRRVPLHPAAVEVSRITRRVLADMEPRLGQRQIDARLELADPVEGWADRRALEQVLSNLFDNAIKYTDPGGSIRVRVEAREGDVRVSVMDTGMGIPVDQQARIFERFYRVDKARSRALGGTGLGLAIVKHLVQAMGGDVFLESEPGRGSSFSFTLPRADGRT